MSTAAAAPSVRRRSALEAADSCLYRFDQLENKGVPDTSEPAQIGVLFHACVVGPLGYIPRLAAAKVSSDSELAEVAFREALSAEHAPSHLLEAVHMLYLDFVENFRLDVDAYLLAEQRQTAAGVSWSPDLVYARVADGLSELEIVDLKSWRSMLTDAQAKKEFQAQVYAWQARLFWPGFDTYRFTFFFTRFQKTVSVVFTSANLDAVPPRVEIINARIERARQENHWPATPGQACQFCRLQCPILDDIKNAALIPQRILSSEQAEGIGAELLVLQQALALRKAVLRKWVEQEGPVQVQQVEWALHQSERQRFPVMPVIRILETIGVEPKIMISQSALGGFLKAKKWAHIRDRLLNLAQRKTIFTFSAKKVGGIRDEEEDGDDDE